MNYQHIPCRITIKGDVSIGKKYIGLAKKKMNVLENKMKFQNLSQDAYTVRVDGVIIECWSCFNIREVAITVGVEGKKSRIGIKEETCFCNRCVSVGVISKFGTGIPATTDDINDPNIETKTDVYCNNKEWIKYPYFYYCDEYAHYDVTLCSSDNNFVVIENCRATDHTPHCVGDLVICHIQPVDEVDTIMSDNCFLSGGCVIGDCPDLVATTVGVYYNILPLGNLPEELITKVFTNIKFPS